MHIQTDLSENVSCCISRIVMSGHWSGGTWTTVKTDSDVLTGQQSQVGSLKNSTNSNKSGTDVLPLSILTRLLNLTNHMKRI